jgi:class 3 adenylate cyclase
MFRKYALLFGLFVSAALISGALVEIYFSYQDSKSELLNLHRERAKRTAEAIESFLGNVESQMGWLLHAAFLPRDQALEQHRTDFVRLLKQTPAITEIAYVDAAGMEQLLISRLTLDRIGSGKDHSKDPVFVGSRARGRYFDQVYFRRESEPYMRVGLADRGKDSGGFIAEVNLKFIWDVVTQIEVGKAGYGFAVDSTGLLIAHPDISLVLRKTDLSQLAQVANALSGRQGPAGTIERNRDGLSVLSSHAAIDSLGWTVFVESPTSEALAPVYGSIARTLLLLAGGVVVSLLASLYLTRRMIKPIHALQLGAAEIGSGNLEHQIQVHSGDELQDLADDFNRMTARLRESYDQIERLSTLKRYFSPHLAELIASSREQDITASHRREITVVFCDLRNFTRFSSNADPVVVMDVLREYFDALDRQLLEFGATVDHYAGDGLMAFFNDPLTCKDPGARAVRMAVAMRQEVHRLIETWNKTGGDLGFGIGISSGEATLGAVGSEEQFHYTAIGSVANLASRLCDEAEGGQILISESVFTEVNSLVRAEPVGALRFKGFPQPIPVINIAGLRGPCPD